jgi:hypothetical protein
MVTTTAHCGSHSGNDGVSKDILHRQLLLLLLLPACWSQALRKTTIPYHLSRCGIERVCSHTHVLLHNWYSLVAPLAQAVSLKNTSHRPIPTKPRHINPTARQTLPAIGCERHKMWRQDNCNSISHSLMPPLAQAVSLVDGDQPNGARGMQLLQSCCIVGGQLRCNVQKVISARPCLAFDLFAMSAG